MSVSQEWVGTLCRHVDMIEVDFASARELRVPLRCRAAEKIDADALVLQ